MRNINKGEARIVDFTDTLESITKQDFIKNIAYLEACPYESV